MPFNKEHLENLLDAIDYAGCVFCDYCPCKGKCGETLSCQDTLKKYLMEDE